MNEKLPSSEASSGVSMANPLTSNPSPSYGIPSISPTNIRIAHPSLSAPLAPTSGGYLHSLQGGSNLFNHPRNINLSANITHPSYHTSSSSLPAPTHTALTAEEIEAARKRILLEEEAEREAKKNRGNYRCSKCGEPKKGHVCKFQPRYRKKEAGETGLESTEKEVQVEIDPEMTVRLLPLDQQGTYESYLAHESHRPPPRL